MGLAGLRVSGGLPGACRVLCGFFAASSEAQLVAGARVPTAQTLKS